MAIEIKIPQISEDVESANVTEILVKEGDKIEKEQSVIVVESEKASVEVPSSHAGIIKEIKLKEGDEVKVGDVILILEENGDEKGNGEKDEEKESKDKEGKSEDIKKGHAGKDEDKNEKERLKEEKKTKKKSKQEKDEEIEEEEKKDEEIEEEEKKEKKSTKRKEEKPEDEGETEEQEGAPASPGVRRFARELGVDISSVKGSGTNGRITEDDVKSHLKKQDTRKAGEPKLSLPDFEKWGATEKKSLSGIRIATGKSTTSSWQNIPHVFQFDEAEISGIENYIEKYQEKTKEAGVKLTITAILVKIAANALQQFPKFNASIDTENEEVILKKYISISIAVATENGLLMPVVRDVNKKKHH